LKTAGYLYFLEGLDQAMEGRRRGRPALKNSRIVATIRLTPEEKQQAERKAKSKGQTFSAYVRKLILKALDLNP